MSYQKRIFREFKKARGCFLNWPLNRAVRLGDYGFFNSWTTEFDWQGNLASSGINLAEIAGTASVDEVYSSKGSVDTKFNTDAGTTASAKVNFRVKHAVAFRGQGVSTRRLNVDSLTHAILKAEVRGALSWHPGYLVVTEIFEANSFSSFVSGSAGAELELEATNVANTSLFNLADPSAGLGVSMNRAMEDVVIAQQNVTPYFICHRMVDRFGARLLKRYG